MKISDEAAAHERPALRPSDPCVRSKAAKKPVQSVQMTYIVNDNCIKCKYMDCVEVCPVDCFYEGENMLVIHPDECIDCGVCEPECAKTWPNITTKKEPPADAKDWEGVANKFEEQFSSNPGSGD